MPTFLFQLIEDEKKEKTKPTIQLPEHLRIRPVTPVEKYIKVRKQILRLQYSSACLKRPPKP